MGGKGKEGGEGKEGTYFYNEGRRGEGGRLAQKT